MKCRWSGEAVICSTVCTWYEVLAIMFHWYWDKRNILRFEGERKAGCSEQNSRSVPLDLLHRIRGCVPQCAQPACVSSKYIRFPSQSSPHKWSFSLVRLCTGQLCLWWLDKPWSPSGSRTTRRWCPCTRPVCSSTWQASYSGTWVIHN